MNNMFRSFLKCLLENFITTENWQGVHHGGFDFFDFVKENDADADHEYIDKALQIIKKYGPHELKRLGFTNKSQGQSTSTREEANELFKKKDWLQALKEYTKSIALAENNSVELGFAYANRAALLLHRGFYKECLEDIDRALEVTYPENKKAQLRARQDKARKLLPTKKNKITHHKPPTLINENPNIKGASNKIKINHSQKYGRFMEASRDINPGDILVIEDPYTLAILPDYVTTHCSECGLLCFNLIPCKTCCVEMYCGEDCRTNAYVDYHKYECIVMKYYPGENNNNLGKYLHTKISLKTTLKGLKNLKPIEETANDFYKDVIKLVTHMDEISQSAIMVLSFNIAKQFYILKNHTDFLSELKCDNKETILKSHLLRNRLMAIFNLYFIQYLAKESVDSNDTINPASGLFLTSSLFNHSCVENVAYGFYGSTLVLRALTKIKKGEQCFCNYGYSYYNSPKSMRQVYLQRTYLFSCNCIACKENWPTVEQSLNLLSLCCTSPIAFMKLEKLKIEILQHDYIDEDTTRNIFKKCYTIKQMIKNEGPININIDMLFDIYFLALLLPYQGKDF